MVVVVVVVVVVVIDDDIDYDVKCLCFWPVQNKIKFAPHYSQR
jgi:hypothetical protein